MIDKEVENFLDNEPKIPDPTGRFHLRDFNHSISFNNHCPSFYHLHLL